MNHGWTEAALGKYRAPGTGPFPHYENGTWRIPVGSDCLHTVGPPQHINSMNQRYVFRSFHPPATVMLQIDRLHFQEGKFAVANLLVAAIPKDKSGANAKYSGRYLTVIKDSILVPLMQGTANVTLKERDLLGVPVQLSVADQTTTDRRPFGRIQERLARCAKASRRTTAPGICSSAIRFSPIGEQS